MNRMTTIKNSSSSTRAPVNIVSVSPCLPLANVNPWRSINFTATYKTVTTKPAATQKLTIHRWYTDKSFNPKVGTGVFGAYPLSCGDAPSCLPTWSMWLYSNKYPPRDTLPMVGSDSEFEREMRRQIASDAESLWLSFSDLLETHGSIKEIYDLCLEGRKLSADARENLMEVIWIYNAFSGENGPNEVVKYTYIDTSISQTTKVTQTWALGWHKMTPKNLWALSAKNGGPYVEVFGLSPDDGDGPHVPYFMKVNNARAEIMQRIYDAAKQVQCAQYLRDYCTKWLTAKHNYEQMQKTKGK